MRKLAVIFVIMALPMSTAILGSPPVHDHSPKTQHNGLATHVDAPAGRVLEYSKDGSRLLTSNAKSAIVLDLSTMRQTAKQIEPPGGINHASISDDGKCVLTVSYNATGGRAGSGEALLWRVDTGEQLAPPIRDPEDPIWASAINSNHNIVASCGYASSSLQLFTVRTRTSRKMNVGGQLRYLRFLANDQLIAATSTSVDVIDVSVGAVVARPIRNGEIVVDPVFSADGSTMLVLGRKQFVVYDVATWKERRDTRDHPLTLDQEYSAAALSANGKRAATVSNSDAGGRIWDTLTGSPVTEEISYANGGVAIDPSGGLAVFEGIPAVLRSTPDHRVQQDVARGFTAMAFSPNGQTLALGYAADGGSVSIYNVAAGTRPGVRP